jgi:hypothetical protein
MNVFPYAGPSACFSDAVIYRLRVRSVSIALDKCAFAVGADEVSLDCTFDVPASADSGGQPVQQGRCTIPTGEIASFRVDDENGGEAEGVHVFAGQRSDPFFLDGPMAAQTLATRQLAFKQVGSDRLYGKNVLAIVLQSSGRPCSGRAHVRCRLRDSDVRQTADPAGTGRPAGNQEHQPRRKIFDPVNRDLEIRDLYNNEDAFNSPRHYVGAYRARLNANLVSTTASTEN